MVIKANAQNKPPTKPPVEEVWMVLSVLMEDLRDSTASDTVVATIKRARE